MNTPSSPLLRRVGLWLAFIWLAVFVIVFYALRNPFIGEAAQVMLHNVLDLLAVIALAWLGGALGALAIPRLDRFNPLEQAAFQALAGLGALAVAVLALGLLGLYPPGWLAWLLTLGGLLGLFRPAMRWARTLRDGVGLAFQPDADGRPPSLRRLSGWVVLGSLAMLALVILPSFAPPTDWDSLVYHLAGPRLYLQAGRIIPFADLHFLGFPSLTESLYLWLMIMARPQAAALLHAAFGLLMATLLIGMGYRLDRPLAGWLAVLILLLNTELQNEFHVPFSDLSAMAFATAGLWLTLAAFQDEPAPDLRCLALAGVMTGLAMDTKYTLLSVALALGLIVLWLARRGGVGGMLRAGMALALPALAACLPWLIKNALIYGNPVAPFVWGTSGFDQIDQTDYLHAGSGLVGLELIKYPLIYTFLGGVGDWRVYGSPGPLMPGLLPLALIGWRERPRPERDFLRWAAIFVAMGILSWMYGASTSSYLGSLRLAFPFFPALAMVGGLGLAGLRGLSLPVPVERFSRLLVLLAIIAQLALACLRVLAFPNDLRVSLGMMGREDYLRENLPAYYDAIQRVNALPPGSRVLMLWESRTFYCERECIPDSLLNQWRHDLLVARDPHEAVNGWRARGIDYVLICDAGMNAAFIWNERGPILLTEADVATLAELRQTDLRLVWDDSDGFAAYSLYEVR